MGPVLESASRSLSSRKRRILLVEDDAGFATMVADVLARVLGVRVEVARNLADGWRRVGASAFDAIVLDRGLPDGDGFDLLRGARSRPLSPPVVVLTADARPESIVAAMRVGARDYVVKSGRAGEDLAGKIAPLLAELGGQPNAGSGVEALLGGSEAMAHLRDAIRRCAPSGACVLIEGETGVGKELVARALHAESGLGSGAFVAVNCGALPEHLIESELFGHVRGAFTGAHRDHDGLIAAAARGTLFLDEIEDLPAGVQGKLLRFLQEGEYRAVGAARSRFSEARVIAATNVSLAELVHARRFRSDLFYRLNVLSIRVPPLRRRLEDLESLVSDLLRRSLLRAPSRRDALADSPDLPLPKPALEILRAYDWPGNVRELSNVVERVAVFARALGWERAWAAALDGVAHAAREADALESTRPCDARFDPDAAGHGARVQGPIDECDLPGASRDPALGSRVALRRALDRHGWSRGATAHALGISRVTLWRRMRRLGLGVGP